MTEPATGTIPAIPRATYRLQLHRGFTFADAERLVPYLRDLGISHLYCSPYLKARAGSTHGYDIVDHAALNPEIGDRAAFERLAAALRAAGMGQVLDIVPNHMGVGGDDNPWWLDVLEHGQASPWASFFDIDWQPAKAELSGKLLLPILEDHYGAVLEQGLLRLAFDAERGRFAVHYHEHRLPIDPASYGAILRLPLAALERELGPDDDAILRLRNLIADLELLPPHTAADADSRVRRTRDAGRAQTELAALCARSAPIAAAIRDSVGALNGLPGDPVSLDRLHALLERQPYRVAFWRTALDEINYRRFFDINGLAGLRQEEPQVFERTHSLVLALVADGLVRGLRLDHPDGLYDPRGYFRRLAAATPAGTYRVAEKILAGGEALPDDWPLHGTTGYDFLNLVNGWQLDPDGERPLARLHEQLCGDPGDFGELLYACKQQVMRTRLSGELMVLANLLDRLSEADRRTRDFTLHALRTAIAEYVAGLPVYRTYVDATGCSAQDRRCIEQALAAARRRGRAGDLRVFDFLERVLLAGAGRDDPAAAARLHFAMKLQQFSAPVMAKGMEDCALYRHHRLVSVNEVGGDPRRFALDTAALHHANAERARRWPQSMLAGSTHDSKRSEDVRARLNVLSERPGAWRAHVQRWRRLHRGRKRVVNGAAAPSAADEYLLYQTLVGSWPLEPLDEHGLDAYRERIAAYLIKAVREAGVYSSWLNPDAGYEQAVGEFVAGLLTRRRGHAFLEDLSAWVGEIAVPGLLNGLSQTLIRLTAPGVPDVYQGTELWDWSLVDPDNRRPVDFGRRAAWLADLRRQAAATGLAATAASAMDRLASGHAKLFLLWRALAARAADPDLYAHGDYRPLPVRGPQAAALCAFARRLDGRGLVAVAARYYTRLLGRGERMPGAAAWAGTEVGLPRDIRAWTEQLTGEPLAAGEVDAESWVAAGTLLARFPVALLHGTVAAG